MSELRVDLLECLRCPSCAARLRRADRSLVCRGRSCGVRHPFAGSVPVLIDESRSVFVRDDFLGARRTFFEHDVFATPSRMRRLARRLLPELDCNLGSDRQLREFVAHLRRRSMRRRILVVGGGIVGRGMEPLIDSNDLDLVETDVSLGPRTQIVCDCHALPFEDAAFDGVIAKAVLEHVLDPAGCVAEIARVLTASGVVYVETPFMQQVHGGRYDFTRFSLLGHRRLFRAFDEVSSGAIAGPGTALGWAWQYFLLSFATTEKSRWLATLVARITGSWPKLFDPFLVQRRPAALDGASAFWFCGTKAERVLDDRALLAGYRGGQ